MSKLHLQATGVAIALCKDAYGNALSGNEVRSMKFLALAIHTLEAQSAALASKNDVRQVKALERVIRDGYTREDEFPPFDDSKLQASLKRWAKMGISGHGVLDVVPEEAFGKMVVVHV